jgi:ureidoacrylate peracid hydrolase
VVDFRREDGVMEARRIVSVEARPAPLSIDLAKTAVLVIDMQNDFGSKGGMFDRAGIDVSVIQRAVDPTARVIASARAVGVPVIYVKEGHRPDLSDIGAPGSPYWRMCQRLAVGTEVQAPDGRSSRIHVEDTWNTEILPELAPLASDIIIKKRRWSAFYDTELDARLRRLGARYLVITGCTTSMCIESTIRDAAFRDFICLLPADCTGQPARPDSTYSGHEASLNIIELSFGWVSSSDSIGRAFEAAGASSTATDLRAPAPRGGGR